MAGNDSQWQLFTLIRDFANEKSLAERRVSSLKKRIVELQQVFDSANEELERVKRSKIKSEQELRGSEVELTLIEASIQAQESRISLLQEEISKFSMDLAYLKNEEAVSRDEFVSKMYEVNREIRNFHEKMMDVFHNGDLVMAKDSTCTNGLKGVEDEVAFIKSQICNKEQEYREDENFHNEVLYELSSLKKRVPLMEAIRKESEELQEFSRYPFCHLKVETSCHANEQLYASLVEDLRRKYKCPSCRVDNMGDLAGILSVEDA
ncbi:hypothetical protein H6P81_001122 [Aristolochia fimbriata]|uniref:Uncharacterized protein n=1 Tax=Aristolochia fimbriata TaxID=158543 RepID=A0AAV7F6P2_ARIFI|nr:hypothetical protein H6P81_001122 [Aristolochia fimbriata]